MDQKSSNQQEWEDIKGIKSLAAKYPMFKTREDELAATSEYYDLKKKIIPYSYSIRLAPEVLNLFIQRSIYLEQEICNRNWNLIIDIARKPNYMDKGIPLYDRCIHGWLGAKHALTKFDPYLGNKYGTYATMWIHQHIQRAIAKYGSTLKIAGNVKDIMSKIRVVTGEYISDPTTSDKPSPEKIYEMILKKYPKMRNDKKFSPEKVAEYGRLDWDIMSLNAETSDEEGSLTLQDYIPAPDTYDPELNYEEQERKEQAWAMLEGLEENERLVIIYRFGMIDYKERTHKEIAKMLGMKQVAVKELEESALLKLKNKVIN